MSRSTASSQRRSGIRLRLASAVGSRRAVVRRDWQAPATIRSSSEVVAATRSRHAFETHPGRVGVAGRLLLVSGEVADPVTRPFGDVTLRGDRQPHRPGVVVRSPAGSLGGSQGRRPRQRRRCVVEDPGPSPLKPGRLAGVVDVHPGQQPYPLAPPYEPVDVALGESALDRLRTRDHASLVVQGPDDLRRWGRRFRQPGRSGVTPPTMLAGLWMTTFSMTSESAAHQVRRADRSRADVLSGVEPADDVLVVVLDHVALDLHRRGELAGLDGEVVVEQLPLLDRSPSG